MPVVLSVLLILAVCVSWLLPMPVRAQAQDGSGVGSPAAGAPYIPVAKERYRLFVFGDKMATGLLAGLWRVLKDDPGFVAKGRFNAGSGLARVRYYDWPRAISQVLQSRPVDIGVVLLGINDVRDIFVHGRRIPFGSEEWKSIYASRVDAVIQAFRNNNVALYWVGLPPVRDARLDAGARLINDLLRARTTAHGVRFIDIRKHFAGPDGGFVFEGPDVTGRKVRLRARNGIHFIRPGNTKLAKIVMDVIRQDVEAARGTQASPGLAGLPQSDKPFVGKAGPDGQPIFVPPFRLPGANVVYLAKHNDMTRVVRNTLQALRESVAPGSAGHMLFVRGVWPAAPAGRLDDFSLPGANPPRQGAGESSE